jgi:hypothetical protein
MLKINKIIVICLFVMGCNFFDSKQNGNSYPEAIIENQIQTIYDKAKENISCLNVEILGKVGDSRDTIPLIECDIILENLDVVGNTIFFRFCYKKKSIHVESINRPFFHTIVYRNKELSYALFEGDLKWDINDLNVYLPLKCEILRNKLQ